MAVFYKTPLQNLLKGFQWIQYRLKNNLLSLLSERKYLSKKKHLYIDFDKEMLPTYMILSREKHRHFLCNRMPPLILAIMCLAIYRHSFIIPDWSKVTHGDCSTIHIFEIFPSKYLYTERGFMHLWICIRV